MDLHIFELFEKTKDRLLAQRGNKVSLVFSQFNAKRYNCFVEFACFAYGGNFFHNIIFIFNISFNF